MALTKVNLANTVEGVLPVANGGTGSSSGISPGGSSGNVQYNNAGAFGGSNSFVYDGSGNLILGGNTTPAGKSGNLVIESSNGGIWWQSASSAYMGTLDANPLIFYTNNAERMRILSGGNLLLGLSTGAVTQFTLTGDISHRDNAGGVFNISNYENAALTFSTNTSGVGGERMRIDASGNVGIGTSSVYAKLSVQGNYSYSGQNVVGFFYSGVAGSSVINIQDFNSTRGVGLGAIGDNMIFYNSSGGTTLAEAMRLSSSGNLGIGTSSPAAVTGFSTGRTVAQVSSSTNYGQLRLGAASGTMIDHDDSGNTITTIRSLYGATSASAQMQLQSGFITFGTGTSFTERMRITAAGGVAFGGASNYGSTGQYLKSNGDAPPTWTTLSTNPFNPSGTWNNVLGSRSNGTTYTNSTGYAIQVANQFGDNPGSGSGYTVTVNGVTGPNFSGTPGGSLRPFNFTVPNGATYAVSWSGGTMNLWWEFR